MKDAGRDPFSKIYVISLPSSKDRRAYVAEHLRSHGLADFEFHDAKGPLDAAVDRAYAEGLVAGFPPCFRCGKISCGKKDCNNVLIPPQVAVFTTYLDLWKKMADRDECALVCEDDVVLHPWWRDVMAMIVQHRNADTISLDGDVPALIRLGWGENGEHSADSPFRISREIRMSNPCHLITSAYAKELLSEFRTIAHTVDVFLHKTSRAARQWARTAHPPAATELSWSKGTFESLIHPKPIRAAYLRDLGRADEAEHHEAKRKAHISHLFHRAFLIIGHPRCGTGFTARFLTQMGLDIGHERDGRDGIASWMFAADGEAPYALSEVARRREALRWETLIMPVRDINTAIPSIMNENTYALPSYEFRRKKIDAAFGVDLDGLADNFQRAVASFLNWNRLCEKMSPDLVYRIESDHEVLYDFVEKRADKAPLVPFGKLNLSPVNADKAYKGIRHEKPPVSSMDWGHLPEDMWKGVLEFCAKHDYRVPERFM